MVSLALIKMDVSFSYLFCTCGRGRVTVDGVESWILFLFTVLFFIEIPEIGNWFTFVTVFRIEHSLIFGVVKFDYRHGMKNVGGAHFFHYNSLSPFQSGDMWVFSVKSEDDKRKK